MNLQRTRDSLKSSVMKMGHVFSRLAWFVETVWRQTNPILFGGSQGQQQQQQQRYHGQNNKKPRYNEPETSTWQPGTCSSPKIIQHDHSEEQQIPPKSPHHDRLGSLEELGYEVTEMDGSSTRDEDNLVLTHYKTTKKVSVDDSYEKTGSSVVVAKLAVWSISPSSPSSGCLSVVVVGDPSEPQPHHHDSCIHDDSDKLTTLLILDIDTKNTNRAKYGCYESSQSQQQQQHQQQQRYRHHRRCYRSVNSSSSGAHTILASFWTYTLQRPLSTLRHLTFIHVVEPDTQCLLENKICPREDVAFDKFHRAPCERMAFSRSHCHRHRRRESTTHHGEVRLVADDRNTQGSWADLTTFSDIDCHGSRAQEPELEKAPAEGEEDAAIVSVSPHGRQDLSTASDTSAGGKRKKEDNSPKLGGNEPQRHLQSRLVRIVARMVNAYPQVNDQTGEALHIERIVFSPYRFRGSLLFDMDVDLDWG